MKKQITRLLALVIAIVMAVTVVPVLPAKAAGNLEISIQGNGGVFEYVLSGQTDSTTGCGNEQGTAGKTVADAGYTQVSDPVHESDSSKEFEGW